MINYRIIEPINQIELDEYYKLRWITLRKKWGQDIGTERDISDADSMHRMIIDHDAIAIAVGRLHFNSDIESQIRYMGVHPNFRRDGFGTILLDELEKLSLNTDHKKVVLQSRESALNFYLSNGYKIEKKTYLLFNSIQHFLMSKELIRN